MTVCLGLGVVLTRITRKHSSRMRTVRLQTIRASATRCQYQLRSGVLKVLTSLQWWPPDIASRGAGVGWARGSHVWCVRGGQGRWDHVWWSEVWGLRLEASVRSNASWIMVIWGPSWTLWTDRHNWKYYGLATSLAGGKYWFVLVSLHSPSRQSNHPSVDNLIRDIK